MEKITLEIIQEYISANKMILASTHAKLCIPVINRIYKKMQAGIEFFEIKVDEMHICDGHHRYIASLLAKMPVKEIPSSSTSATEIIDWEYVIFVEEDWDTPEKIQMLNELDADFNNISIKDIEAILK